MWWLIEPAATEGGGCFHLPAMGAFAGDKLWLFLLWLVCISYLGVMDKPVRFLPTSGAPLGASLVLQCMRRGGLIKTDLWKISTWGSLPPKDHLLPSFLSCLGVPHRYPTLVFLPNSSWVWLGPCNALLVSKRLCFSVLLTLATHASHQLIYLGMSLCISVSLWVWMCSECCDGGVECADPGLGNQSRRRG